MQFNLLLRDQGIDPADVSVILHTTNLHPLRERLAEIVADFPLLFDAYQSVHSAQATAILRGRPLAASFVPYGTGTLIFAGLFGVVDLGEFPVEAIYADPRFQQLATDFGATDTGPAANIARGRVQTRFEMTPQAQLADMVGRLVIDTPAGRTYVRLAANLEAVVRAILPSASLHRPAPGWRDFVLTAADVRTLTVEWAARLREWRGIYLIVDQRDGSRYVGSAYGEANLLGRWQAHVVGDVGVTAELTHRDPEGFRFSILELVAPSAEPNQVVLAEANWKHRLDTRTWGLNRN